MALELESTRISIIALTAVAWVLEQAVATYDYLFQGMFVAAWYNKFPNGKPLYLVYTGLPIVDQILMMPVSFWTVILSTLPELRLQSSMLSATLLTIMVWQVIESARGGKKPGVIRWAIPYGFAGQCLGQSHFFPFYCYFELQRHFTPEYASDPSMPYWQAVSLLPACLLSFLHPFLTVFFPSSGVTESQYQLFIAWGQLGPFICFALMAAFTQLLSGRDSPSQKARPANADAWWIKLTYAVFGIFTFLFHVGSLIRVAFSKNPSINFNSVFIPNWSKIKLPDAAEKMYGEEGLFFLTVDFIIIALASAIWITRMVEGMNSSPSSSWSSVTSAALILISGFGCFLVGPGALVSAVLYYREDYLRATWAQKQLYEEDEKKPLL